MYSNQYYYPTTTDIMRQQNIAYIKEYFKKPRILVLAIITSISSLSTIFSFILSFFSKSSVSSLYSIIDSNKYTLEFNNMGSISIRVITNILFIIALFIIYFKSKNPNPSSTPKSGVTILYVFSLINFIFLCIGVALLFIFMLIFGLASGGSSYSTSNSGANLSSFGMFVAFCFLGVFAFLGIFWSFSIFRFLSSIKKGLTTSAPLTAKGATATGVFYILSAVFTSLFIPLIIFIPTILKTASSEIPYQYHKEFSALLGMTNILVPIFLILIVIGVSTSILYAIISLGYKKHINQYTQNNQAFIPPYTPSPYPQAASPYNYVGNPTPSSSNYNQSTGENQPPSSNPVNTTEPDHKEPVSENHQLNICPTCGVPFEENASFCETCGQKLK